MTFTINISPSDAKSIKLSSKELYQAAAIYFKGKEETSIEA